MKKRGRSSHLVARRGFGLGRAARPRRTLAMISSAGLCQMKGFGSSFQCSAQISMASIKWGTEVNAPRRSRRSVSSLNQRSMRLSHERMSG